MTLEEAVNLLMTKYEEGKGLSYVVNPLSWALYQVWKESERRPE